MNTGRKVLGAQVDNLRMPPFQKSELVDVWSAEANIGVPVRPFPRWMRCVKCGLLSPFDAALFEIKENRFRPERTRSVHKGCRGSKGDQPAKDADAVPARFLLACRDGHLDDFPWHCFVHGGNSSCKGTLRFFESGASLQTENLWVKCDTCGASRSMAHAFGKAGKEDLPSCRARHPHLDHFDTFGTYRPPQRKLADAHIEEVISTYNAVLNANPTSDPGLTVSRERSRNGDSGNMLESWRMQTIASGQRIPFGAAARQIDNS